MNWDRLFLKLGSTIILLFLVVLLPLGFVMDQIFSGFYYRNVQENIDQLSARYARAIAETDHPMRVSMIEMMAEFSQIKLFIVNSKGEVIANSGVPGIEIGSKVSVVELEALSQGGSIDKIYEDSREAGRYLVSGKPAIHENTFYGGVYVLSSIESMDQSVKKVRNLLILSGIGSFSLALGFTYVVSKKISNPLVQIEKATRRIAKGDLETRIQIPSKDEIGSLAYAINDLAKDLQRYRDTRREFFANISHELRTPITYLEGYAQILKNEVYQSEEEKRQYLDIIHQESIHLTRMIEDLFDISKMEEGKMDLNFEWIDLTEVVENVVRKGSLKAKEKGIDIRVHIQEGLSWVYGDGLRMEQIFTNLLNNAIRYTDQGSISVHMSRADEDQVLIEIEDTGIGIPENELPYIFERFYRVEKSRSRQYGGTGLGLAIVKNLVELQGGEIQVTSEIGKGTRFSILFPISLENNIEREGFS
jgi:signal transduction histidine kinase